VSFREIGKEIKAYELAYFTASCDKEETNKKFAASLGLDYPILSDPTRQAAIAYGLVKENAVGLGRFPNVGPFTSAKTVKSSRLIKVSNSATTELTSSKSSLS